MLKKLKITVIAEDSVPYDSPLSGQHGISMLLTAETADTEKNILVDVAQDPVALLENFKKLSISPACIDAVVLTHCHFDHTAGLSEILKEIGKEDVPVVAHPDLFRLNFVTEPFLRHVGVTTGDDRKHLTAAGGLLFLTKEPLQIMPGLMTTGEVQRRTDFEDTGMDLQTIEDGKIIQDHMMDDISLVAHIEKKGLVVVTGCCHAGIVNVLGQARKIAGIEKISGLIGGLHLIEASEDRIHKTISHLRTMAPDWIYAGHCTGFKAQVALYNEFKSQFSQLQTGMVIEF
jgi:7,8-dihydropterin-6-yl-methyl-4-(beta-D-ribofuranosyl)aminobenzene 5'-phosphate synthase